MDSQRKDERAPILAQVEAAGPNLGSLGRARDLSVGGLLIQTRETLPLGAAVVLRFVVPPEKQPLELAGKVVRSEPGKQMAIAFIGLPESYRKRILDYIQQAQAGQATAEQPPYPEVAAKRRRSARIPRRIAVVLNWQDETGKPRQEAAETKYLSRYGALLTSYSQLEPGRVLRLQLPERGDKAPCRVVYSTTAVLGQGEVAVEFVGIDNFWDVPFPDDGATLLPTRRRCARMQQAVPLELSWETPKGIRHQEATEARDVSKHGVGLTASGMLETGRIMQVRHSNTGRGATARIVWRRVCNLPGRVEMGLEFLGRDDFWSDTFPPDRDYTPPDSRPAPPDSKPDAA